MDLHKPKPIRNWRELLTEVGVIVLSVCIALSAEQAVEWWHWRSEVAQARQSIRAEMLANNVNFYARRIALAPCIDKQRSEAEAILAAIKAGRTPSPFTTFRPAMGSLTTTNEWQSERASQVLTHFPRAELALLGRYYALAASFGGWLETKALPGRS